MAFQRFSHNEMATRLALYNARRMAKAEFKRKPNWVLYMELFATGSTMARKACADANIDPDLETTPTPYSEGALQEETFKVSYYSGPPVRPLDDWPNY